MARMKINSKGKVSETKGPQDVAWWVHSHQAKGKGHIQLQAVIMCVIPKAE